MPPEIMCPLVHPPAIRAPNIKINPPINAQTALDDAELFLYFFQFSCTIVILKLPFINEPTKAATMAPNKKIASHEPRVLIF